jgi:hypothetical protein
VLPDTLANIMGTKVIESHFKIVSQGINHFYSTDNSVRKHLVSHPYEANDREKNWTG